MFPYPEYILIAAFDIFFFIMFYLVSSLLTRDRGEEIADDTKWNRVLLKAFNLIKKFHVHTVLSICLAFLMINSLLAQVGDLLVNQNMTYLQKVFMINLSFVVIGILFLLIFFEKIRLFRKDD